MTKKKFPKKVSKKNLLENLGKSGSEGPHWVQLKAAALGRSQKKATRSAAIFLVFLKVLIFISIFSDPCLIFYLYSFAQNREDIK